MTDGPREKIGTGRSAVIYARASEPNERERTPVDEQLTACRLFADELGYAVTAETTLSDTGPNVTSARPGLSALLRLVAEGSVHAIIVHTLDRLARPESQLMQALLREMRRREVPIYMARTPRGYRYDATTGELLNDPAEVAEASREEWRPPDYIIIPREDEPSW